MFEISNSFDLNREIKKRKMENLKIVLGQWQKLMNKYDRNSMKLQRKISDIIKKEWSTSNHRSESDIKKFIERAGIIFEKSGNYLNILEKFTSKAEQKVYRSIMALDSLMCQVENDLEDLLPEKKCKFSQSSSESDEDESEEEQSEYSQSSTDSE